MSTLKIGTATFSSFEDKHYYDEALVLLDSVRDASKQAIGQDQSSSVDLYITTEEVVPLLQEYLLYKRALDFLKRPDVERILFETATSENEKEGCAGCLPVGLATLILPILLVNLVGGGDPDGVVWIVSLLT